MKTVPELAERFDLHTVQLGCKWRGDCPAFGYRAASVPTQGQGRVPAVVGGFLK